MKNLRTALLISYIVASVFAIPNTVVTLVGDRVDLLTVIEVAIWMIAAMIFTITSLTTGLALGQRGR